MSDPFHDHFSGVAGDYRAYRPVYPPALFAFLAEAAPGRDLAWDCGTGNGQAAVALAGHFAKVFATDASAGQLANAEPHPHVEYAAAPAEKCPLPDASVDLVTVAQAVHWFDLDRFYAEVRRVAKPGGVIAAWTYDLDALHTEIEPVMEQVQNRYVRPYWPPERAYADAGYRTLPFPFPELERPHFKMTAQWDLAHFVGYINTWSAVRKYEQKFGHSPMPAISEELAAVWGDPATVRPVRWKFSMRLGRVS
ncbi:sam-dependent methyltransferase : SAM-dependent methyltransferase, putative OS=Geobacter metallireducens (strain GS-15 / ATCC 53774 / DSM 7210) GN=Gmet_0795 PE=4 SV=1: Methyltransf_11 [Gemmataceae bacterium]|nr:sam-dependent methyltransferase : SAM-dependent methyltransferase, putative OS=Geobacter metallireducens (strain GS-15 / ATCC 53774 / DSM 7210) GN=Gmet_0795 PE=4 SV=1: Methyltransf_11 [Gemmataceae bacterium]VTU00436.1 sam-dependent methyltransferase : SAM-dependent methyltransferase, putative OS=Geobacter metallireducens (strain GS-15 / ATCC 53774 / DSM 7210) GN=Gmet_0795 PE=4 SV=1: Methyltransf_11 [Gemmataceae bacterium]